MVFCDSQFDEFNRRLSLNDSRVERIDSAVNEFVRFCNSDLELKVAVSETPFFQGSYSTDTAIRPLTGDEFDIDIIYPFSLNVFNSEHRNPGNIVNWFISRLKQNPKYEDKLKPMPRCARIDYAGDFHLDIIPATMGIGTHQPYAVPTRDLKGWIANDPKGIANWVRRLDAQSKDKDSYSRARFCRAVRVLKHWRDSWFSDEQVPSSILLLTMLGKHEPLITIYNPPLQDPLFPKYSHDAAYIYDMVRLTLSCIQLRGNQSFFHPTIPNDNLAVDWQEKHLDSFLQQLKLLIKNLQIAIWSEDKETAIEYYKKAFGDSFPAT